MKRHSSGGRAERRKRVFTGRALRLKTALDKGDEQSAGFVMDELRAMDALSAPARELYIFLYDALLMGETEKAVGGLTVWLKMC